MKQITIAALLMMMATSAIAILDPAPDTIGIYLEAEAETMCVEGLVDGDTDFTFYMVLTNPTFDAMQTLWAAYHFEGAANVTGAVLGHAEGTDSGTTGSHFVEYDTPVPASASMLLMTLSATYYDYEYGPAVLELHNHPLGAKTANAPHVIGGGGEFVELNLTYEAGATIRINADCGPVANESLSIDGIKSLYR